MARFQPAPDLWDASTREALDTGALVLQPGQWIRTGRNSNLSRFYRHNPATGHVVAFHGQAPHATGHVVAFHGQAPHATRKMRAYIASGAAANGRANARIG